MALGRKGKLEGLFADELALLQPTPGYMRLLKASVLQIWKARKVINAGVVSRTPLQTLTSSSVQRHGAVFVPEFHDHINDPWPA